MEEKPEEVKKKRRGGPRKKSTHPERNGSNPNAGSKLKELWADPVWAAAQREKLRIAHEKRRGTDTFRTNVPDGMRKAEADALWAKANRSAKRTIKAMAKNGAFDDEDDPRAIEALEFNITTMRGKHDIRARLAAAAKVLEYTKSKPVVKSAVTLSKAEDWLAQVAAAEQNEETQEDSGPAEDTQASA
jgi:hypothetical protein